MIPYLDRYNQYYRMIKWIYQIMNYIWKQYQIVILIMMMFLFWKEGTTNKDAYVWLFEDKALAEQKVLEPGLTFPYGGLEAR